MLMLGVYRLQHRQCSDPADGRHSAKCKVQPFCGVVLDVLTFGKVVILDPGGN